jgi:hypothetical protein
MKKQLKWKAGAAVRAALRALAAKRSGFDKAGKQLLSACGGTIFPADVYFIATCNRALQNFDAFRKVMAADYYSTAMILLRVQLDSVLRSYGLTLTADPHEAASAVAQGTKLDKLKDKDGNPLKDFHLVATFVKIAPANAAVKHIYELTSGYVHLSEAAMHHVLGQTKKTPDGQSGFYIGSAEPEVPVHAKLKLVQAFDKVTETFLALAADWVETRRRFGDADDLMKKYGPKQGN